MYAEFSIGQSGGERLDKFLVTVLPNISRHRLQQAIEEGEITVLGTTVKRSYRLKRGDEIGVRLDLSRDAPAHIEPESMALEILYEDDDMLVLNKPRGLVVHPAPGHPNHTLVNALLYHCQRLSSVGGNVRPGLVHRLDKDTSGVIAIAKNDAAHLSLAQQIKHRTVEKRYLAIVYGTPSLRQGTIAAPIGRHPVDRKKMAVVPVARRGKDAVTHYSVLRSFVGFSLLRVDPLTGRTHQIRVHLSHAEHPILGDPLYGSGRTRPREIGDADWKQWVEPALRDLTGQALHAESLILTHPGTGERLTVSAPLPEEMQAIIAGLEALSQSPSSRDGRCREPQAIGSWRG